MNQQGYFWSKSRVFLKSLIFLFAKKVTPRQKGNGTWDKRVVSVYGTD